MYRVDLLLTAGEPKTWRSRVHVILRPVNARARYGTSYGLFRIVIISQNCCASHDMSGVFYKCHSCARVIGIEPRHDLTDSISWMPLQASPGPVYTMMLHRSV